MAVGLGRLVGPTLRFFFGRGRSFLMFPSESLHIDPGRASGESGKSEEPGELGGFGGFGEIGGLGGLGEFRLPERISSSLRRCTSLLCSNVSLLPG